jgi:phage terminase small subunit
MTGEEAATSAGEAELTRRQQKFIEEYLVDLNGTQAAIRAGYAESGAATEAYRLLRNAEIAAAIDATMAASPGVTRTRIIDELALIGFANMLD